MKPALDRKTKAVRLMPYSEKVAPMRKCASSRPFRNQGYRLSVEAVTWLVICQNRRGPDLVLPRIPYAHRGRFQSNHIVILVPTFWPGK